MPALSSVPGAVMLAGWAWPDLAPAWLVKIAITKARSELGGWWSKEGQWRQVCPPRSPARGFSLTPEQIALKRSIVEFAEATLNDDLERRDLSGEFPRGLWRACAAFGIQSLSVPAQYSGAAHDTDILSGMLAMEALGYGCRDTGLTFALSAQMWTVQLPIARFGSEAQKRRYLGPMCAGECIGAHAITEEHAGSDVFSMQTLAARADGGYCLSGEKWFVSLAGVCDVALVFATVDPSLGRWGISAFLVDMNTAGVSAGESVPKMGLRTVPMARIVLDDCFVPTARGSGRKARAAPSRASRWSSSAAASWRASSARCSASSNAPSSTPAGGANSSRASASSSRSPIASPICACGWRLRACCCTRPPGSSRWASRPRSRPRCSSCT